MSVTETRLISVAGSASGNSSDSYGTSYTAVYFAKCSDPLDTPDIVLAHFRDTAELPWIGRRFKLGNGEDQESACRGVVPKNIEKSAGCYHVTCTFEPTSITAVTFPGGTIGTDDDGELTDDPLEWHEEIDVGSTAISEPCWKAQFRGFNPPGIVNPFLPVGKIGPIVNSALVPFDPTLETTNHIKVIRISRSTPDYFQRRPVYDKYRGTVNIDHININKARYAFQEIILPYTGWIVAFGSTFRFENGKQFYWETIEIHVNKRTWIKEIIDHGNEEFFTVGDVDDDGNTLSSDSFPSGRNFDHKKVKDEEGYPSVAPVLLDGHGKRLKPPNAEPVWLKYATEGEELWAPLTGGDILS